MSSIYIYLQLWPFTVTKVENQKLKRYRGDVKLKKFSVNDLTETLFILHL